MTADVVAISSLVDAPAPWRVERVDVGHDHHVWHLVDANGHTLISSSGVNGRGPLLQRRMLERIAASVNAMVPVVVALARAVLAEDERGVSSSTKRHHASSLLAQSILFGAGIAEVEKTR